MAFFKFIFLACGTGEHTQYNIADLESFGKLSVGEHMYSYTLDPRTDLFP